jgi:aryl-alcohol dehydrogenase-like predicted oxidoreductase
MTFGRSVDQDGARALVNEALDAGVTFFDTADGYSDGESERLLGNALKGHRREVVIATKFYSAMGPGPNDSGMSRKHMMDAVEDSLRRLQTDYIDIYYIHHVDWDTPLEEMLRAGNDLVQQGKVRYMACSNYEAWRLAEALHISELHDWASFVAYQPQYSLVVRDIEAELVPLCQHKGLGIVPWAPLGSGFLTGKYKPGQREVEGARSAENWAFFDRFFAPNADETLQALLDVADELGRPPAQVALRWVMQRPGVTAPIAGARTLEQLRENLGATQFELEGEPLERLNEVSKLRLRYPQSFEWAMKDRRARNVDMPSLGDDE